jgi:FkbM family methyltransferase
MGALTGRTVALTAGLLSKLGLGGLNQLAKRVLTIVTGDHLRVDVDGLVIEGPVAASRILTQIAAQSYEVFELSLFRESLTAGMVVVDVGANVGYYTLIAARIVGSRGHVFAFEPDPRTLAALRTNVAVNGFRNVTTIDKAALDVDRSCELYLDSSANRSSLYQSASLEHVTRREQVEATTVDNVLGELRPDVVKIDVEGAEPAVLRGMRGSLKTETVVFLEFAPPVLTSAGTDPDEFREDLLRQFASVEMIAGGRLLPFTTVPGWYTNLRCSGWRGSTAG